MNQPLAAVWAWGVEASDRQIQNAVLKEKIQLFRYNFRKVHHFSAYKRSPGQKLLAKQQYQTQKMFLCK